MGRKTDDDDDDDFLNDDETGDRAEESPDAGGRYCVWLELTPLGGVRRICIGRTAPADGAEIMGEFPDICKAQEFATGHRMRYPLGVEASLPGYG